MNPPPIKTRLLGHPITFLPMTGITAWSVYQVIQNPNVWPMTVALVVLMNMVVKASARMAEYKTWKLEWDGMAPASRSQPRVPKRTLGVIAIAVVAAYLGLTIDQPGHMLALGSMAALAILAAIIGTVRKLRGGAIRHSIATPTVTVCITKPLLPVPDLTTAYKALPAYCWQVL